MSSPGVKRSPARYAVWIPDELTTGILWMLPNAASLARFRCVSRSWRRILSEYITRILFSDDQAARRITVARCSDPESWRRLLCEFVGKTLFCDDQAAHVMIARNKGKFATTTSFSIHSNDDDLHHVSSGTLTASGLILGGPAVIAGSSRGIFCLWNCAPGTLTDKRIILWNPTTSETKVLPSLAPVHPSRVHGRLGECLGPVGFGFDPITNDYKVLVRFTTLKPTQRGGYDLESEQSEKMFVYSVKGNSYKRLHGAPVEVFRGQRVLEYPLTATSSRSEKCHWLSPWCTNEHYYRFTRFDVSTEAFTTLQVPVPSQQVLCLTWHNVRDSFHVAKDGSCLVAVFSSSSGNEHGVFLEVWAELDYATLWRPHECSWTMLYSVSSLLPPPPRAFATRLHVPRLWKDGKLFARFVMGDDELRVVDLEKESWMVLDSMEVKLLGKEDYLELVTYFPSLVSLSGSRKRQRCRLVC